MKKLIIAAALVLTATSGAFAQYGAPGYGYYDAAPGYRSMRHPATAIITARRRATVTTARLRRGSKTTPNAAAPARASAPAVEWESARNVEAR